MQREATLIAEDIERLAARILSRGSTVFTLIEEGSGLLSGESLEEEAHAIHLEFGC